MTSADIRKAFRCIEAHYSAKMPGLGRAFFIEGAMTG
jgi:hypothetical protein